VPGLLRDKCISLLKALPKQYRKLMVPVPDTVDRLLPVLTAHNDVSLLVALSTALAQIGIQVPSDAWQPQELEAFYRANFQVFDADGKLLGQGRDLAQLKQQLHAPMTASLQAETQQEFKRTAIEQWDFGELPAAHQFRQAGVTITAYPALVDQGETVALQLLETPERAQQESECGLIRLLQLQTQSTLKWLRKELLRGNLINLQLAGIDQRRENWIDEILVATYRQLFVTGQSLPRTEEEFRQRLQAGQGGIIPLAQKYAALLHAIAEQYAQIRQLRRRGSELAWLPVLEDIDRQLAGLFQPGFIAATPWDCLQQYPRYLQAIGQRLEKLRGHFQRDRDLGRELTPLQGQLDELLRKHVDAQACPSLQRYRWLLEEYRVSLFAQTLGTREPVSAKRLRELWDQVRKECVRK
jgi:ATP-dependent helicase HrpA